MTTATADSLSWQAGAACQYTDPELFFPEGGEFADVTAVQADQARGVCLGCPVRPDCLAYALATGQQGIWGGLSERERLRERRGVAPGRTLADIMADADARYLRRRGQHASAGERAAGHRRQALDAEPCPLLGLVA